MLEKRRALRRAAIGSRVFRHLALLPLLFLAVAAPAFAQTADLVVNQSDNPNIGPAGGTFTYTVVVADNGPDTAQSVFLVDSLPTTTPADFISAVPTQGTCTLPPVAGVLTCALGDIAFQGSATVIVTVRLPVAGVYSNSVSVSSATTNDNNNSNNSRTEQTTAQIAADMAISAVPSAAAVAAGQPYSYSLTASNHGPNDLTAGDSATIAFTVPAGSCVTSTPTGSGWVCSPSSGYPRCSGAISCTRTGALASGANAPTLTVNAVANQQGSVSGSFSISSTLLDGDSSNNTATATVTVSGGSSDVSISKGASPTTVALNGTITYTLTPRLNGGEPPGTAGLQTITVTDNFPAGVDLTSTPSGSGWACTPNSGFPLAGPLTITCKRPGPYTGGNFTNMPTIVISGTATQLGPLSNSASIGIPEDDPVPGNNTATANATATNDANLQLTKTASLNPVVPGQPFNFTLSTHNAGPLAIPAAETITVTDTLPAGVNLTAAPTGSGWTCTPTSGFPIAGASISCQRPGPLAVNANAPAITVPSAIPTGSEDTPITNTACVGLSGTGPDDPTAGDNCGPATVTSTSHQANLAIVKSVVGPNPVLAGQDLTYLISVTNAGPDDATNVVVSDTLASLVTTGGFQSATPSQGGCTPSTVTNGTSQNLSCNLGTVAAAAAAATITVVIRPSIALTGTRANTATVTSTDVGDPNRTDNTSTTSSGVTAVADVQVSKTASPTPVQAGTSLTFVVTARNNGPSTALNVVADDTMSANAAFVQLGTVTGGGSCTTPAAGAVGGHVICTWTSLASGAQQTATYVVRPLTDAAGSSVDNAVHISTDTLNSNTSNDDASTSTAITPALVDIVVNKVDSADPIALGQLTTYTITTTNGGPSFATVVHLVDTFPTGAPSATFSYQGSLTISPPGVGTCTEPSVGVVSGVIDCTFPGLANGASAVITYVMRADAIASGISGTSFNSVVVSAHEPETQLANNNAQESTTTRRTADLSVVKTAPASATPGTTFDYTLTVGNAGPNNSVGAKVVDTLPSGLVFQSATGCSAVAQVVTCTLGTLANGGTTTLTITVLLQGPTSNPIANSATVTAINEVDPNPSNNTSSASTTLGASVVDLSLQKTVSGTTTPGQVLTYRLTVHNAGPSPSTGAIVTDPLPTGLHFVSASAGCVEAAGIVTCTLGTLASGQSVQLTINASVDADFGAGEPIVNTASVTPVNEGDSNNGNNTASASARGQAHAVPALDDGMLLALLALTLATLAGRQLLAGLRRKGSQ